MRSCHCASLHFRSVHEVFMRAEQEAWAPSFLWCDPSLASGSPRACAMQGTCACLRGPLRLWVPSWCALSLHCPTAWTQGPSGFCLLPGPYFREESKNECGLCIRWEDPGVWLRPPSSTDWHSYRIHSYLHSAHVTIQMLLELHSKINIFTQKKKKE